MRRLTTERGVGLAVGGLALLLAALHLIWLQRFRSGYVTEWDESGYIALALQNTRALKGDGPIGLAEQVLAEGIQAPLVLLSAVPLHVVFGESVDSSLAVPPLFSIVLVLATYGVARRITTPGWAALAALCVGAAPVVTDYARLFHFSVPAAALATAALWALLRSDDLSRRWWALAFGVFVGLMTLARTMTIAFVPAFAVAALALVLLAPGERRGRLVNLVLAGVAAALVAGTWYVPNLRSVGHYLLNFGYGTESSAYGDERSPLSPAFWTRELDLLLESLYLPLAGALLVALVAGAWAAVRTARVRPLRAALSQSEPARAAVAVGLFVVAGYVAVSSSRNVGTAFSLPWLPALVALAVAGVARLDSRGVRSGVAILLVAVAVVDVVMKAGAVEPLSQRATIDLPLAGETLVLEGRGGIHDEIEGAGYALPGPTEELPRLHRRWLPTGERLSEFADRWARERGEEARLAFGFDDLLFSNTRVVLAAELALNRRLPSIFLKPFLEGGDTTASYRRQIRASDSNFLVTGMRKPGDEGSITVTRRTVEAAGRQLGFRPVRRFNLPDGRPIVVWWSGDS